MKRAILSCTGLDKPEGSLAREAALLGAEATGSEIICPVLLNRSPARYRKELGENALVVIDGCATRCASKLASQMQAKIERKVVIFDDAKASGLPVEPSLRLGPNGLALAKAIDELAPKETDTLCLALLVKRDPKAVEAVKTQQCITIDDCPKACAEKNVEMAGGARPRRCRSPRLSKSVAAQNPVLRLISPRMDGLSPGMSPGRLSTRHRVYGAKGRRSDGYRNHESGCCFMQRRGDSGRHGLAPCHPPRSRTASAR